MNRAANPEAESSLDPFGSGNTYFYDPSHSPLEQHGLEYLDRNSDANDEAGQIVIPGYNQRGLDKPPPRPNRPRRQDCTNRYGQAY